MKRFSDAKARSSLKSNKRVRSEIHQNRSSATNSIMRHNPISTTTLLVILAFLVIPILGQVQLEPIKITKFQTHPGLYFEEMGEVRIINSAWNILAFYDLRTYWMELNGIKHSMKLLDEMCSRTKEKLPFCTEILIQLQHQLTHVDENNKILQNMNQNDHTRNKRGALDIVGNIANKLFGVLDSEYAKYINAEIDKTRVNEQHLLNLIKNHTSVMESTINIFKKNDVAIRAQFEEINWQIRNLSNQIQIADTDQRAAQMFTSLTTLTLLILEGCQKTQNAMLGTLIDLQHGKINPLLVTPIQLKKQIMTIKEHLPPSLTIPGKGENQILLLYRLLTIRSRVLPDRILFSMEIPLLINEFYQLYKLIPIPTPFNNSFVLIEPSSDYISVGLHKDQYYPMTQREVDGCNHLEINSYLCNQNHPIYNMHSNISRCEIELLNHQTALPTACKIKAIRPNKFWIQLHQPNEWLYSLDQEYTVNVICTNKLQPHTLEGSGIVKLREDCIIRQASLTITGHKLYQSRFSASFLPKINLTERLLGNTPNQSPPLYLGSSKLETENILKELKISETQERLPEHLNTYDVHHFTVAYLLLAIVLTAMGYYAYKQKTRLPCCRKEEQVKGKPVPARRSTQLTMDDFCVADATQ